MAKYYFAENFGVSESSKINYWKKGKLKQIVSLEQKQWKAKPCIPNISTDLYTSSVKKYI